MPGRLPIIDMHLHAVPADSQGPPPLAFPLHAASHLVHESQSDWADMFLEWFNEPEPGYVISPTTDAELKTQTLEVMETNNIIGVVSGPLDLVDDWRVEAPDRVIPGVILNVAEPAFSPVELREYHASGRVAVLGEVTNQYAGVEPDDPRFEPYLAVAEELDIPVQIHIGPGPPGAPYLGFTGYRARLHSPLTLEEALIQHPRLRVYVAHAGWPMLDDTLALLWTHPRVHVDVGIISFGVPTAEFHRYLRVIVEAGFEKRVMFGSDSMVWPGVIEPAIESITDADFLTDGQKRAILYENAARFLRLNPKTVHSHHES